MRARPWLDLLAILPAAQALSVFARDDCDFPLKCNDEKCRGTKVYETDDSPSKMGVCTAGDCARSEYTSVCPGRDLPVSCDQ